MSREEHETTEPNFPVGEKSNRLSSGPANSEPEDYAERFLHHRAASLSEEVYSGVEFCAGFRAFRHDEGKLQRLLNRLVGAKVLTQAEADTGRRANDSTISKLNKIAEHSDVILHPKILPFLQPGYTVLYELAKLYEVLEKYYGRD
jgi:hypothetical protein